MILSKIRTKQLAAWLRLPVSESLGKCPFYDFIQGEWSLDKIIRFKCNQTCLKAFPSLKKAHEEDFLCPCDSLTIRYIRKKSYKILSDSLDAIND